MKLPKLDQKPNYATVDLDRLDKANIGARYYSARLNAIPVAAPQKKPLLEYVERLHLPADHADACKSLLLHGPHGAGKSAAASLILVEVMARGPSLVHFDLAANLDHYAMHRDVCNDQGHPMWRLITRDAHFLVIDDLGSTKQSDWSARWIEAVLTERYHRLLTTIITSNVPLEVLFDQVPRLKHLEREAYQTIGFSDTNWRG